MLLSTEHWNNITVFFQFPQVLLVEYSWQVVSIQDFRRHHGLLTFSTEHFIFHQEILARFTSLSWLYEPVSIYLHLFELVTPELNILFYFYYKGDRWNENNVPNVVWVCFFLNTKKRYYPSTKHHLSSDMIQLTMDQLYPYIIMIL